VLKATLECERRCVEEMREERELWHTQAHTLALIAPPPPASTAKAPEPVARGRFCLAWLSRSSAGPLYAIRIGPAKS
jgi:hypothetical protein